MELTQLLTELVAADGSDLHLAAGLSPVFRIHGTLTLQEQHSVLDGETLAALVEPHLSERQRAALAVGRDGERSLKVGASRFRFHIFRERGNLAACVRLVPSHVPTLDELELGADTYPVLQEILRKPRGLVLVVGPSGSGKHTTTAAMIEEINRTRAERIITVEDPIEYQFENKKSVITQRAVGDDVAEFPAALRSAMQEDPDVVFISQIRDLETILLSLSLAETGHLVFTTLGVSSASDAVTRLVEMFAEGQQPAIRRMIAQNLVAVIAQRLVSRAAPTGRVPVNEIMTVSTRVRQMILDGHTDLTVAIEAGRTQGMQTMDDCLVRLYEKGNISAETAWLHLTDKGRLPQELVREDTAG